DRIQRARVGCLHADCERIIFLIQRNLEIARGTIAENRAAITCKIHCLHTRCRAHRKKRQHSLPVIGRTKTKMKKILILWLNLSLSYQSSDLCWCSLVRFADGGVKSAHASEP